MVLKDSLCLILTELQAVMRVKKPLITVLGYHSVSFDDTLVDISPNNFFEQIAYLEKSGYQFISLSDLIQHIYGQKIITTPSVVLTFDDGYEDLLTFVAPILERKRIPATYFVVTNRDMVNRRKIENGKPLLTLKNVKKLSKIYGSDIQAHTTTHLDVSKVSAKKFAIDCQQFIDDISSIDTPVPIAFAYPWGRHSPSAVQTLKKTGIKAAVTTAPGFIYIKTDPYLIPRIMIDRTHSTSIFAFLLTPAYPPLMALTQKIRRLLTALQSIKSGFGYQNVPQSA